MIWLLWEHELDISHPLHIEASIRTMLTDPEKQKKWNISPEYAISTINNINKIFKIEKLH